MCGERVALWERAGKFETNMQRACSKHAGDVRECAGMCGEHVANVRRKCDERAGNVRGMCQGCAGNVWRMRGQHVGSVRGRCSETRGTVTILGTQDYSGSRGT